MKKLFTLAAAVLASVTMMAQEFTFTGSSLPEGWVGTSLGSSNFADESDKVLKVSASGTLTYTFSEAVDITSIDFIFSFGSKDAGKAVDLVAYDANDKDLGSTQLVQAEKQTGSNVKQEANVAFAYSGVKKFTITNSSDKNFLLGYISFNTGSVTPSTDPVTAAEISGDQACLVGNSVTLTCTAAHATAYQWSMNGAEIDGATDKKYTFSPQAAGEFSFTCAASNDYTATPVVAAAHVVTVMDPAKACGELIKATTNGEVSGVIGGKLDTNLKSGSSKKLDKNKYFGITLDNGTFQAGDIFAINITTGADLGNFMLYADKEGKELIYDEGLTYTKVDVENPVICETGLKEIVLPATVTGKSSLYLYREDGNTQWNVTFDYISVSRECGESSNAEMGKVWVMAGEEAREYAAAEDGNYYLVVPASVELAEVEVFFSLAHPGATANVISPVTIVVPAAGAEANSQVITVTAEDGEHQKSYTIFVSKSDQMSTDASLKSLSVNGFTLNPAFAADVTEYTLAKPYGTANPEASAVAYEPNDPTAHDNIQVQGDDFVITITAEDGETQLVYTIHVVEADAKKAILRATFSNGVHGYVAGDAINVPYLAGEAEPTFESATFWNADGEPTAEMVEGKLVVTGVDGKAAEYTINYIALTPMEATYDEITFEDVPSYIYSVYGWDSDKGVKFSKDVEEATNHRISEGKDRIYIALPAAKEVKLTAGVSDRPIKVTVNGVVDSSIEKTGDITISLSDTQANLIGIESNGSNGDAGFTKIQLVQEGVDPEPTLYTVTIAETKNGTIVFGDNKADHKYAEGEKVRVVITPDEGYKLVSAKAGEKTLLPDQNGIADFTMPAEDVTVSATFEEESQGIDDINASMKATKRLINGVLFIEKNGKLYNAQGVEIK